MSQIQHLLYMNPENPKQPELEPQIMQQANSSQKKLFIITLVFLLIIFSSSLAAFIFKDREQQISPDIPAVADEIIIKFKKDVPEKDKQATVKKYNLQFVEKIGNLGIERYKIDPKDRNKTIKELKNNPNVEYAEFNRIGESQLTPNDPRYTDGSQWNLPIIKAPAAWDITQGDVSVVVALIDTGINSSHLDLAGKINAGYNTYDNNTITLDVEGHGTKVGGLLGAATNNSIGIASLGWNIKIMPVRDTDTSGFYNDFDLMEAIDWAASNGAKVINISQGGSCGDQFLQDVINAAWNMGKVIVASSGNVNGALLCPGAYNHVLAVGATNSSDIRWSSSAFGIGLDVMAPGVSVLTTTGKTGNGSYATVSGTSGSVPEVSALAALMLSINPNLTNQQVVDIIRQTADKVGGVSYSATDTSKWSSSCGGWNDKYGCGRINAYQALLAAQGVIFSPSPSPSPTSSPSSSPSPVSSPNCIL